MQQKLFFSVLWMKLEVNRHILLFNNDIYDNPKCQLRASSLRHKVQFLDKVYFCISLPLPVFHLFFFYFYPFFNLHSELLWKKLAYFVASRSPWRHVQNLTFALSSDNRGNIRAVLRKHDSLLLNKWIHCPTVVENELTINMCIFLLNELFLMLLNYLW